MSKYSANVKTLLVDPRYHDDSRRTEFRLDEFMYFSNMRLANIGAVANVTSFYNRIGGSLSLIKNIYLYDGNQLLDQLRDAYKWLTFDTLNNSNSKQESEYKYLQMNGLGFVRYGVISPNTTRISGSPPFASSSNDYPENTDRKDLLRNTEDNTSKSWLDLRRCFGLLREYPFIPGRMFKNLRIVIEWRNTASLVTSKPIQAGSITKILKPLLIVDQLMNEDIEKNVIDTYMKNGLNYYSHELDRVVVPLAVDGTKSENDFELKGFNNKYLRRCLVVNEPSNSSKIKAINDCSIAQDETFRIHVNGKDIFPRDIDLPNMKVGMCTDTFGTLNSGYYANHLSLHNGGRQKLYRNHHPADQKDLDAYIINNGLLSYLGFILNNVGNSFQIKYTRKGSGAEDTDPGLQAFNMNVIGEVKKRVQPTQNGYLLQYPSS